MERAFGAAPIRKGAEARGLAWTGSPPPVEIPRRPRCGALSSDALRTSMMQTKRGRRPASPSKRKPRGSGQERREQILAAAKELFTNEGYARVTTRALAAKAGLSQTGLYLYFETKEDILRAISEETHNAMTDAFDRAVAGAGPPREIFERLLRAYIDFGLSHPAEYQLTFTISPDALAPIAKDFSQPSEQQNDPGARSFMRFRDHLTALAPHGLLGGLDPIVAAQILWFAGHGAVSLLITRAHFPWADRAVLIDGLVGMVINGLGCRRE
jgi:AcrR family transcriptional regulator